MPRIRTLMIVYHLWHDVVVSKIIYLQTLVDILEQTASNNLGKTLVSIYSWPYWWTIEPIAIIICWMCKTWYCYSWNSGCNVYFSVTTSPAVKYILVTCERHSWANIATYQKQNRKRSLGFATFNFWFMVGYCSFKYES